ncbi:MAG: cyclase family protein [Methanobacteriaceae archaeon]|jgi:kynurenine formamidase|nr:cyclase family protein [Candidatus Methanorudis spinitermitis]
MRFIDLTHELKNDTQVYPGDPKFILINSKDTNKDYSLLEIGGNLHTGTHIDAPYHYIANGKKVKNLLLENLIGKSNVFDISHINPNKEINIEYIPTLNKTREKKYSTTNDLIKGLEKIIILKTSWCNNWGDENYFTENPYISKEVAKIFVENNISGVAIDSPSVDSYGENKIHKIFLKNNIWIVENLTNMNKIYEGIYKVFFIPLNIDAEASFIRAFIEIQ